MISELRRRWHNLNERERSHVTWLLSCIVLGVLVARLVDVGLAGLRFFEQ